MSIKRIEDALKDIREGRMVILVDDEDRENEGDLCMAASKVTPMPLTSWPSTEEGLSALPLTRTRPICSAWT